MSDGDWIALIGVPALIIYLMIRESMFNALERRVRKIENNQS